MGSSDNLWNSKVFSEQESAHLSLFPIIVYQGKVPRSGKKREVAHPFSTWWWIKNGGVKVTTKGESVEVGPEQWIFIPNGLWRRQEFAPETEIVSINFAAFWRGNLPLVQGSAIVVGERETVPGLLEAALRVTEAHNPGFEREVDWVWVGSLSLSRRFRVLAELYTFCDLLFSHAVEHGASIVPLPPPDARIDWIVRDLQTHLRAGPLPFERWQERTGLSRSQLERLAKKHLNTSLHAYRDELLATATCRALTSHRPLVKQVADQFGFVDTAHFCRWLRARTGHTPATLQKLAVV